MRSNGERHSRIGPLHIRKVDVVLRLEAIGRYAGCRIVEVHALAVASVARDADDGDPREIPFGAAHSLAERILGGPEFSRDTLADHSDVWRLERILPGKFAALQQGNSKILERARIRTVAAHHEPRVRVLGRASLGVSNVDPRGMPQHAGSPKDGGLHSGDGLQSFDQAAAKTSARGGLTVTRGAQIEAEGQKIFRSESEVGGSQLSKALEHEPRSGKKHEGKCDFRCDKNFLAAAAAEA